MRSIELKLPKKWSDLKKGEIEKVAGYFLSCKGKAQLLTRCFIFFSGWKIIRCNRLMGLEEGYFYFTKKGERIFRTDADVFTGLAKRLEWITREFTLPTYVPRIKGFPTPNLILYKTTLEQYLMADNFYIRFISTGDFRELDKMIAALYTTSIGDLNLKRASRRISRKRKNIRYAAFIWFSGVKTWLRKKYPWIFSGFDQDTATTPDKSILSLLSALNGGDITKNKIILSTGMHEALYELNQKIEQSKSNNHVQAI